MTIGAESLIVRWFKMLTTSLTDSRDSHGRPHPNNFHCGWRNADHQLVQEPHSELIGGALGVQLNIDDAAATLAAPSWRLSGLTIGAP